MPRPASIVRTSPSPAIWWSERKARFDGKNERHMLADSRDRLQPLADWAENPSELPSARAAITANEKALRTQRPEGTSGNDRLRKMAPSPETTKRSGSPTDPTSEKPGYAADRLQQLRSVAVQNQDRVSDRGVGRACVYQSLQQHETQVTVAGAGPFCGPAPATPHALQPSWQRWLAVPFSCP